MVEMAENLADGGGECDNLLFAIGGTMAEYIPETGVDAGLRDGILGEIVRDVATRVFGTPGITAAVCVFGLKDRVGR